MKFVKVLKGVLRETLPIAVVLVILAAVLGFLAGSLGVAVKNLFEWLFKPFDFGNLLQLGGGILFVIIFLIGCVIRSQLKDG